VMRFYLEETQVIGKCTHVSIPHRYGYNGSVNYLFITPLSDRAFVSMTSAYASRELVSIRGPPGTGKTETVKDLAKKLGINCLVCNSSGIESNHISRIIKFAAATESWVVFDEFNRLKGSAMHQFYESVNLMSSSNFGLFCTWNSTNGKDPNLDILKTHFHHLTFSLPDIILISSVLLASSGFFESKKYG